MKTLSCLAMVGVLAMSGVMTGVPLRAEILEEILVKVNGEIITKTELEERAVAALERQLRAQRLSMADIEGDEALRKAVTQLTPRVLLEAVDELVIMQRGRELGYRMTDERFNEVVANIRKENNLESDEEWKAALAQEGLTLAEFRSNIEQQMIMSQLQRQEVFGRVSITEEEARAYYEKQRDEFTSPESVMLREILVALPDAQEGRPASPAAVEAAQKKLDDVQARLDANDDFADVAAEMSDASSRANGGLLGPLTTGELSENLQQRLAKLEPGQATDAMETNRGWHIIKLESRNPEQVTSFDEARDEIDQKIFEERHEGELQKYLARLRSQAIIEWKNDEVKRAYEQAVAEAGKQQQSTSQQTSGETSPQS